MNLILHIIIVKAKKNNITTCLVSSDTLEFAKLMLEQNTAVQAHHLRRIIKPHMENTIPITLKNHLNFVICFVLLSKSFKI